VRISYDFHIHSCLSPCCDDEMTPNNIVNMSVLKELQVIAVTDHNTVGNLPAILEVAQGKGLMVVPAMELCTQEEIHMLCLFPSLQAAKSFEDTVFESMDMMMNRPEIFGNQWLLDANDEVVGTEKRMLIGASGVSTDKAIEVVKNLGGVVVPAHIDRDSYSMVATFGMVPKNYGFRSVEVSRYRTVESMILQQPEIKDMLVLSNSDAHQLVDISEPEHTIEVQNLSIESVLLTLRNGNR